MKKIFIAYLILLSGIASAQNVGIGITNPIQAGLVVNRAVGNTYGVFGGNNVGVSLQAFSPGIGFNEYFNGVSKFIGSGYYAGKISMSPTNGDFNIYTSNASGVADAPTTMLPRLTLNAGGLMKVQGASNGYIFADRTSTNYTGWTLYANAGKASLYRNDVGNTITVDSTGALGLQGVTTMTAPLTLNSSIGNKIDFYYGSATSRYGIGLQGGLLQMYSDGAGSDIAFGYGSSNAFTENMRIRGNGDVGIGTYPAYKLDVAGRMRVKAGASSAGIWLANNANTADVSFVGQFTDTKFGVYGAGGWKFAIDNIDGTVYCGSSSLESEVLTNAVGYKLKVFGKIIGEEVRVQLKAAWPDYVFAKEYKLTPLSEVERFITQNKHLSGFKKAAVIESEGADLGDTQRRLLEKVEELTLYLIEANKKIEQLQSDMKLIKKNR